MRRLTFICALSLVTTLALAQRITRRYDNASMSKALMELNDLQREYTVNFIYDELEDFKVTTDIRHEKLTDAILQIVGFYPIRVVKSGEHEIFVECTHKTDRHLTGTIKDEQGVPVAYANVAILNPTDSTLLSGGVSNESGYFAVPYEQERILARISYVGYKTIYRLCSQPAVGTIRMQPDNYTLNGVVVQGERPKVVLQGNSLMMNVEGTVMERLGTAEDVLTRVPMIAKRGEGFEILGKGTPLIYLNNRKLTDLQELRNVQSDMIRSVEVIQNPGARYNASVNAVIIIRTKRAAGEGLGVELVKEYTACVKQSVKIPVIPKMTPNITHIAEPAAACLEAGADAISAINTIKSVTMDADAEVAGQRTISGYSGRAVRPIALRYILELTQMRKHCSMVNSQCSMVNGQCSMVNGQCSMFNVSIERHRWH